VKYKLQYLPLLILIGCSKGSGGDDNPPPPAALPAITIEDLSLFEGNGGSTSFNVQVKLNAASQEEVSVNFSLQAGTAKAGEDFVAASNQILRFAPGETQKNISISVVADDIREGEDELSVQLSNPTKATLSRNAALVTIRNDDSKVAFTNDGYDAPTSYPGYTLAWADEFNAGTLDASSWSHQNGDGCDINLCGWGNNELEYYTNRPENLFFQDGKLIIEARKENFATRNYTSSKIISSAKRKFKYGRVDVRAKLPTGKGIWPAFWMLPQDNKFGGWPTSGEIDIMEMVGHDPIRTHGTVHYGPGPGSTSVSRSTTAATGTLHDKFHVYSIEWEEDEIRWYLDGNLFSTFRKSDVQAGMIYPFNEDFYFIINLAVGGNWPGSPDATTYFPQWLIVDYIRVYQ
jgi:beta-glucanase (GH16 family)